MKKHYKTHRNVLILLAPILLAGIVCIYYIGGYWLISRTSTAFFNCIAPIWSAGGICQNMWDYLEWGKYYEKEMEFYKKYYSLIKIDAEVFGRYHIHWENIPQEHLVP